MPENKPKFVLGTYYTRDTEYENVYYKFFLNSIRKFPEIKHYSIGANNHKDWNKNVAQKPKIISDILDRMNMTGDNRLLVFVDADATIEKYPVLFDNIPNDFDIGYHSLDWATWYNRPEATTQEVLSGTMFFRNNNKVRKILTEWYNNAIISNKWEQKVLADILAKDTEATKYAIPLEYCYINTLPNGEEPHVKIAEPFIVHHQASRTLKRIINKQD